MVGPKSSGLPLQLVHRQSPVCLVVMLLASPAWGQGKVARDVRRATSKAFQECFGVLELNKSHPLKQQDRGCILVCATDRSYLSISLPRSSLTQEPMRTAITLDRLHSAQLVAHFLKTNGQRRPCNKSKAVRYRVLLSLYYRTHTTQNPNRAWTAGHVSFSATTKTARSIGTVRHAARFSQAKTQQNSTQNGRRAPLGPGPAGQR